MIPFFLSTLPSSRSPLLIQFKHLASIDKIIEMRDIRLRSEVSKGLSTPCLSEKESIWVGYTELDHTLQTDRAPCHSRFGMMKTPLMINIDVVRRGGVECTSGHAPTFSKKVQTSHFFILMFPSLLTILTIES